MWGGNNTCPLPAPTRQLCVPPWEQRRSCTAGLCEPAPEPQTKCMKQGEGGQRTAPSSAAAVRCLICSCSSCGVSCLAEGSGGVPFHQEARSAAVCPSPRPPADGRCGADIGLLGAEPERILKECGARRGSCRRAAKERGLVAARCCASRCLLGTPRSLCSPGSFHCFSAAGRGQRSIRAPSGSSPFPMLAPRADTSCPGLRSSAHRSEFQTPHVGHSFRFLCELGKAILPLKMIPTRLHTRGCNTPRLCQ